MVRPVVTGVLRRDETLREAPKCSFEQAHAIAAGIVIAVAVARWLSGGGLGFETLMLLPLYATFTPVVMWWCGHGVLYWCKDTMEFVALDEAARPFLAKTLLVVEFLASAFFAFAVIAVRVQPGGGC